MLVNPMQPFYFGPEGPPLFGCLHNPPGGRGRSVAVVFCYPMGREYIMAHRTCRQLATRLARSGFHALRFDYHGCGDSAGEDSDAGAKQWMEDIGLAIDEVKRLCGVEKVCLAGLALGASMAALVAAQSDDIASLVLWDPVVKGGDYAQERLAMHKEWLNLQRPRPAPEELEADGGEVLGFPLTAAQREELAGIDLLALECLPAERVMVMTSRDQAAAPALQEHLIKLGGDCEFQAIPWEAWTQSGEAFDVLVPPAKIVQSIVDWIAKVHP